MNKTIVSYQCDAGKVTLIADSAKDAARTVELLLKMGVSEIDVMTEVTLA